MPTQFTCKLINDIRNGTLTNFRITNFTDEPSDKSNNLYKLVWIRVEPID